MQEFLDSVPLYTVCMLILLLNTSFNFASLSLQGCITVLDHVCQMADVSAGGVGVVLMPATLMVEFTRTESW